MSTAVAAITKKTVSRCGKKYFCMATLFFLYAVLTASETLGPEDPVSTTETATTSDAVADYAAEAHALQLFSGFSIPEAPPSLFSWKISDTEIELTSSGSWEMLLENGGLHFGFDNGAAAEFQAPVFTQTVDFSLSLIMDKRWYFETSFADSFSDNTFAAGYTGSQNELLQSVRIGNCGLTFPSIFTFINGNKDSEGTSAWGISASLAGKNWNGWLLAKLENSAYEEKIFSGTNEITEKRVSISTIVTGKWFYIPPENAKSGIIAVYVENSSGSITTADGIQYRKLDPSEYMLSPIEGILTLKQRTDKRVAVVLASPNTASIRNYIENVKKLFTTSNSAVNETVFNEKLYKPSSAHTETGLHGCVSIQIEDSVAFLIQVPGYFNPLSIANRYAVPGTYDGTGSACKIVHTGTTNAYDDTQIAVIQDTFTDISDTRWWLQISTDSENQEPENSFFPLANNFAKIYFPAVTQPTTLAAEIYCRVTATKDALQLGTNIIPTSITVYRDNITDSNFTFNESSGILTLTRPPAASENIKITFCRTTAESSAVNVTALAGVRRNISDHFFVQGGTAIEWNISKDGYADETIAFPGQISVTAETAYNGPQITAGTAISGGIHTVNASGWYRILGMDSAETNLYPNYDWFYQAADNSRTDDNQITFEKSYKIPLIYRETVTKESLGNVSVTSLRNSQSAIKVEDRSMPYAVTDSEISGCAMVLEWDNANNTISDPTHPQWTAAEIRALQLPDYSVTQKFEIALRNPDTSNSYDVYLQLGIPDASAVDVAELRTWKLTGLASPGVTKTFDPENGDWQTISILLTESDRTALTTGNGIRIIAVPIDEAGRLAVGPIASLGTPFSSDKDVTTVIEPDPAIGSQDSLANHSSASVIERFTGTGNNRVLGIYPSSADSADISVYRYFTEVTFTDYNTFGFFMYIPKQTCPTVTVSLYSTTVKAINITLPTTSLNRKMWYYIEMNLDKCQISANGKQVQDATVTIYNSVTTVNKIIINANLNKEAILYFDEFHFSNTELSPQIKNKSWFTWKQEKSEETNKLITDMYVSLTAEPSVEWKSNKNAQVQGTAETGAKIGNFTVSGSTLLYSKSTTVFQNASHKATGSLGNISVAEEYFFNKAQNAYRRNFSTGWNGSGIPYFPFSFSFSSGQTGSTDQSTAENKYSVHFTTSHFSTKFTADFSETIGTLGIDGENYGSAWIDSWRNMIYSSTEKSEKRDSAVSNATTITIVQIPIKLTTTAKSSFTALTNTEDSITCKLAVPTYLAGGTCITPYYERISITSNESDASNTWSNDINGFVNSLSLQSMIWKAIPFYEFVDNNFSITVEDSAAQSGYQKYNAVAGLQWTRPIFSTIADFFIPSSAELAFGRTAISKGSGVSDLCSIKAKIAGTSLNMFGSYGAVPFFTFYTQDEFYQMYNCTADFSAGYLDLDITAYHSAKFIVHKGNRITIDNAFVYGRTQGGTEIIASTKSTNVASTWKNTSTTVWEHTGKWSPLTALLGKLISYTGKENRKSETTFSSPYWSNIKNSEIITTRKESFSLIIGSTSDFFYNAEFKHSLEASASYVTVSASIATGIAQSSDGVTTGTLTAGLGCKITF